ncbi:MULTISPECIES: DUF2271 domain-containing protein [Flavobacteriaceae]|uniref:DUF2271 domain-containing protein n=1 Tax=Flavobacteriaceae TaxID=49546 RepID=UPI00234B5E5A|nr:DUF2271 domain-containing protein [Muricauda sp. SP22]MDC6361815.1 DUF2271 domain-containing protein [Muricauda sp. SP22]
MKRILNRPIILLTLVFAFFAASSFMQAPTTVSYKCMIQMANYTGEKAYVVVSLINAEGDYVKTLYVQGDDPEWFPDLKDWWGFSHGINENIDAITGATVGNGERNIISLSVDSSQVDSGYKIRFESAVENQEYYTVDAEIDLNSATIRNKVDGKGYIRYIRMVPN